MTVVARIFFLSAVHLVHFPLTFQLFLLVRRHMSQTSLSTDFPPTIFSVTHSMLESFLSHWAHSVEKEMTVFAVNGRLCLMAVQLLH